MKSRKKNLKNDLTSNDMIGTALLIFGHSSNLSNRMRYKPLFLIPKSHRCWCHSCSKGFMSIDEIQKHNLTQEHQRNKEKYLNTVY
jgi:hypothetical protein